MSLGATLLQLLFRFIVSTVYGAYPPRSYVGSDGLLRQNFIIIIIVITVYARAVSRRPWSLSILCEICVRQSGTRTVLSPSNLILHVSIGNSNATHSV